MIWRTEALTRGCQATATRLKDLPFLKEFYLAGGTALALQYGHRISVDLDFFSRTNSLDFPARQALIDALAKLGVTIEEEKEGTLHARDRLTHLSFFRYKPALLRKCRRWQGFSIAHPVDIGLMKIAAIIGRGSRKDFIDLYCILQKELTLAQMLRLIPKKFPGRSDIRNLALRSLVYFSDADAEPSPRLLITTPWNEMKGFFEKAVRRLSNLP